ncbi:hypothetical protein BD309DRAFT_1024526 [Dichomitus squalens]|nr:hypothetical protein BD309DRAFT_1024526 [Dichomitus squalens]
MNPRDDSTGRAVPARLARHCAAVARSDFAHYIYPVTPTTTPTFLAPQPSSASAMKESHDPEKILLLNRDEQNDEEPQRSRVWSGSRQWRGLRNLVVVFVIYGVYTVTVHMLAPSPHDEHHHESLYWAKKAAWKQRGPLSPEKVEEFYLYVPFAPTAVASAASLMII